MLIKNVLVVLKALLNEFLVFMLSVIYQNFVDISEYLLLEVGGRF